MTPQIAIHFALVWAGYFVLAGMISWVRRLAHQSFEIQQAQNALLRDEVDELRQQIANLESDVQ